MVHLDEFARDRVRRSLRRKLTLGELIPFGRGIRILGISLLLACLHRSIGVGAELGFVLGVKECGETAESEQETHVGNRSIGVME